MHMTYLDYDTTIIEKGLRHTRALRMRDDSRGRLPYAAYATSILPYAALRRVFFLMGKAKALRKPYAGFSLMDLFYEV